MHMRGLITTVCVVVSVTHIRHRSLHDKNRILLTSFFHNDIPKLVANARANDNSHKTGCMYADISCFLEGVCKDIKIMYPSTNDDYQYVQRLFARLMENTTPSSQPQAEVPVPAEA